MRLGDTLLVAARDERTRTATLGECGLSVLTEHIDKRGGEDGAVELEDEARPVDAQALLRLLAAEVGDLEAVHRVARAAVLLGKLVERCLQ